VADVPSSGHGQTHTGLVREQNEDALFVEPARGLYAVFDGVGGHSAGDVASALARDVVHAALVEHDGSDWPGAMSTALVRASADVYAEAQRRAERRGMGTTAVVVKLLDRRALIAHVGDSRVYRCRGGEVEQVTVDHTVIAELLAQGVVSQAEALEHPYRNVLSRNLGGQPSTDPELTEVDLREGDCLLLCSDGLSDYASFDGIRRVLTGGGGAELKAKSLVDLALRGGGGDNVTAVVIDYGAPAPRRTQVMRTVGARTWAAEVDSFASEARRLGISTNPVAMAFAPDEPGRLGVAVAEAIANDLQHTTGAHLWTLAESLARDWFARGGEFKDVRELLDILRAAAQQVVGGIGLHDQQSADMLEPAIARAMVVGEIAVGTVLAGRLRGIEEELAARGVQRRWTDAFAARHATLPLEPVPVEPPTPDVVACLEAALGAVEAQLRETSTEEPGVVIDCVERCHRACVEQAGAIDGAQVASDLFGTRLLGEPAIAPLLQAMDRARLLHLAGVNSVTQVEAVVRAAAARRLVTAHHAIGSAVARIVVEAAQPVTDELLEVKAAANRLRSEISANEERMARLENQYDDKTLPGWEPPKLGDEDGPR